MAPAARTGLPPGVLSFPALARRRNTSADEVTPPPLPAAARAVGEAFVAGLREALRDDLLGVYLYGAPTFPDAGPVSDIDCHVLLRARPDPRARAAIARLHRALAERHPLGRELDVYYVLAEDARRPEPPPHLLEPGVRDEAWALHCAHIRAGRRIVLHGPLPGEEFPAPSWAALSAALDHELAFVAAHLQDAAYCVLNLCRIQYSLETRDVVVSKRACGRWERSRLPRWAPLIDAAIRSYDRTATSADVALLAAEVVPFFAFMEPRLRRPDPPPAPACTG